MILLQLIKRAQAYLLNKTGRLDKLVIQANKLLEDGKNLDAIKIYENYLEKNPKNLLAISNLAGCYNNAGLYERALQLFELAYHLEPHSNLFMVNYATLLNHFQSSGKALEILKRCYILEPKTTLIYPILGEIAIKRSNPFVATKLLKFSWLAHYQRKYLVNCFLFYQSHVNELETAKEHKFWADTLAFDYSYSENKPRNNAEIIRVAYYSPDFRNHSLNYFIPPVLKHHNRNKFHITLYSDVIVEDSATENIRNYCDQFIVLNNSTDQETIDIIQTNSHDIIVELAGHTSNNRIHIFKNRLAKIQITGLGYPPTTGLCSIDYKLVDNHIYSNNYSKYHIEKPLILGESFWTFENTFNIPPNAPPPIIKNVYVTFGYFGNVTKITPLIFNAWKEIFDSLPDSKLIVQSAVTRDDSALEHFKNELKNYKIDINRITFYPTNGGVDFFESYNRVDFILDTFPFNGGTTTSCATYMGVPVITLAGEALQSRMGLSILRNLGLDDFIAFNINDYISIAINASKNIDRITKFRKDSRDLYKKTSLGNAAKFTLQLEEKYIEILNSSSVNKYESMIPIIDADDLTERMWILFDHGNQQHAINVASYSLENYPDHIPTHLFIAYTYLIQYGIDKTIGYLDSIIQKFSNTNLDSLFSFYIRLNFLKEDFNNAKSSFERFDLNLVQDKTSSIELRLYKKVIDFNLCHNKFENSALRYNNTAIKVCFILTGHTTEQFKKSQLLILNSINKSDATVIEFIHCIEEEASTTYKKIISSKFDLAIILKNNVEIVNPNFLDLILLNYENCTALSFYGTSDDSFLHWRLNGSANKFGSFILDYPSDVMPYELHIHGHDSSNLISDARILDGHFLAINCKKASVDYFESELQCAGTCLEENWTLQLFRNGHTLSIIKGLGVYLRAEEFLDYSNLNPAILNYGKHFENNLLNLEPKRQIHPKIIFNKLEFAYALEENLYS